MVEFPGEGFQNRIVCRHMMTEASSSVRWWLFQLDTDGLLYSSHKPSILPVQHMHIHILCCQDSIKNLSEKFRSIFSKHNIPVHFRLWDRQTLVHPKDKTLRGKLSIVVRSAQTPQTHDSTPESQRLPPRLSRPLTLKGEGTLLWGWQCVCVGRRG